MIEELWKSIRANLYVRTSSPLSGAFIVAWLIWNYKAVFVLFSSMPILDKFSFIETIHFTDWTIAAGQGFVYPLLSACAVILLYPIPARWVYQYTKIHQNKMKKIRQEIEDDAPMTLAESRELKQNLFRLKLEFLAEISKANDEISMKDSLINKLQSELGENAKSKPIETMTNSELEDIIQGSDDHEDADGIGPDELKALQVIVEMGGDVDEETVFRKTPFHHVQAQYNVELLAERGFVERRYDQGDDEYKVRLTTAGKGAAVENGLIPPTKA